MNDDDTEAAQHQQQLEEEQQMNALGEIAKALAAAQAEMANPKFDSQNPHFKNSFASLASVRNAVVPVLAKHGICMTQNLETTDRGVACTTYLTHESGQQMTFGPLVMPASKPDSQGLGSAATYARRYALMAVCGVVGDEDDDANSATGKPAQAVKPGIGVHSPLGDVNVAQEHREWSAAIIESIGHPEELRNIHADLKEEGEEFYRAVWSLLDSKTRSAFKKAIDQKAAA